MKNDMDHRSNAAELGIAAENILNINNKNSFETPSVDDSSEGDDELSKKSLQRERVSSSSSSLPQTPESSSTSQASVEILPTTFLTTSNFSFEKKSKPTPTSTKNCHNSVYSSFSNDDNFLESSVNNNTIDSPGSMNIYNLTYFNMNDDMQKQNDLDSVVYSGYAASVSENHSEWSARSLEGTDKDHDSSIHDHNETKNGMQFQREPSLNLPLPRNSGRSRRECMNNNQHQTDASVVTSFSNHVRQSRVKRRKQRNENMIAHRQTILSEFRTMLGWNVRGGGENCNYKQNENQSISSDDHDIEQVTKGIVEEPLENLGESEKKSELNEKDNDNQNRQYYKVGKKIRSEVPWIYIGQNENIDADLSSINESHRGIEIISPLGDYNEKLYLEAEPAKVEECNQENLRSDSQSKTLWNICRIQGGIEWLYVALVAASITIIAVLVAIVTMQFT
mmetsp:Transcript_1549/g.1907  ORF Transcript_1549/g.1907 Transcript_1549/m.1907 type:complete len:450 (+) Transcript_1549:191-1540(+)